VAAAARAIPDLATLIFSAYRSGIFVDFQPPRLRDRRQVDVELCEILRGAHPG
jgi:hypothetical protein